MGVADTVAVVEVDAEMVWLALGVLVPEGVGVGVAAGVPEAVDVALSVCVEVLVDEAVLDGVDEGEAPAESEVVALAVLEAVTVRLLVGVPLGEAVCDVVPEPVLDDVGVIVPDGVTDVNETTMTVISGMLAEISLVADDTNEDDDSIELERLPAFSDHGM